MQIASQIISPFHENNIKMSWFALFIRKMQISLLLSQFVPSFKNLMWCELWQVSLLQRCVSNTRHVTSTAHYQAACSRSLPSAPRVPAPGGPLLTTLTLVLSTKSFPPMVAVRCEVQPQPVLAADDGWWQIHASEPGGGKIAESNEQNRQRKSNAWKGNLCCNIIHACCKSRLEKGTMWVCFPKSPLRLW